MTLSPTQRQTLTWTALALAAALLLWLLAPVLTPFLVAAVLAYVLHPMVERLARRGLPRVLAVLLVEVLALLAALSLLLLLVPVLIKEVPALKAQIPPLLDRLDHTLAPWLAQFGIQVNLDLASLKAWLVQLLDDKGDDWLAAALSSARLGGSVMLSLVGNAVLVPVVLFYLLSDWSALVARLQALVPPRLRAPVIAFLDECDAVLGQYLRGQVLVMVALALFYAAALALARFDLALPVGVFTGLAVFVPYIGFGLGLALAVLAALLQFGTLAALGWVALIYGTGQVLESFVLTPRLVGERIGLSPLAVIFALMAFGQLFGFVGVLVALPASAVAVVAARRLRAAYVASEIYRG
ncbi:AI-2E family transporter [Aquabacterium sp. OR-4]|uniref:AI-2E family transporter n=1 Tax=Aquabacterium sp. OR-4 TaxID=2978127 RepID=UPI0021B3FF4F|nr:AI-2E family transporter [Aquabacterium sp. OR-4]MDT7835792.1 AI-2E family transporter [Aquabacterium sp. OR-4]